MAKQKTKTKPTKEKEAPPWDLGCVQLADGPLGILLAHTHVRCDNSYPIGKNDWAYVDSNGVIYLNPRREAEPKEWAYAIAHCLLHLGLGHIRKEKMGDRLWNAACDIVAHSYTKAIGFGAPPPGFQISLPFTVRDEEQVLEELRLRPELVKRLECSTMAERPDMVWAEPPQYGTPLDYQEVFAESLQDAMRRSLRKAAGLEGCGTWKPPYREARDWFISSYPLLGALASTFNIVDDADVIRRMNIPVAAVCPQLEEIYINPRCALTLDEWKFVLAHEILHAALRHDARCEGRVPILWNVACDYVVNGWLVEMNVGVMPESALFDSQFSGMSVEAIYDLICQDIRYYTGKDPGDLLYGDEEWWDLAGGSELDAYYRSAIQRGLEYHQSNGRGYLPGNFVEEVRAIARPPIRWDVELAKWFDGHFAPQEKHRSYARLSRRQSSTPDIPRPAYRVEEQAQENRIYGVLLDTSGSMDRSLLAAALGSIASYSEARDVHHVRVVFCDAAAYDQGVMDPVDIAGSVKIRGRGGTRLQPGIDLLDNDPQFPKDAPLLVITDGECDRLTFQGREHAFLIPYGSRLPFTPRGPVFRLK